MAENLWVSTCPPPVVVDFDFSLIEHLNMIARLFCADEKRVSSLEVRSVWGDRYDIISQHELCWKALWKRPYNLCDDISSNVDIVVEVFDVDCRSLCASVRLLDLDVGFKREQHALLVELFPIEQNYRFIEDIAVFLCHLRFFYSHIWLPWDEDPEMGFEEDWVNECLLPRIELFRDLKQCKIPPVLVERIRKCLSEGKKLYNKLQKLREELIVQKNINKESLVESSDTEKLLLLEIMNTEVDFKAKKNQIHLLETAVYREMMIEKYKTPIVEDSKECFHIISSYSSYENFRQLIGKFLLNFPKDSCIVFHTSVEEAIVACKESNSIYIFPGTYTFYYPSLKCGIVKGHPDSSEVRVILNEKLSVSYDNVTIYENLTLEARTYADMCEIDKGHLSIKNCTLIGSSVNVGLRVLSGCILELFDCEIKFFQVGIVVYRGAQLHINRCVMKYCNVGIQVEMGGKIISPTSDTKYENCVTEVVLEEPNT